MGAAPSSLAPYGAQIALINTDLACVRQSPFASGSGPTSQNITASITAPLAGGSGQQVYFSDLAGSLTIPDDLVQLAQGVDTSYYQISYTATFDTTNEPDARALSQSAWEVSGSVWKPSSDPNVPIPADSSVYMPLGPVILGAKGTVTDFRLANLTYAFNFANSLKQSTSSPFIVTCGRTQILGDNYARYIIASTAVDDSPVSTTPLAPANGIPGSFPPTGYREKSMNANLNISCSGLITGNNYTFTVTGTGPAVSSTGTAFQLHNWKHVFTYGSRLWGLFMTRGIHSLVIDTGKQANGQDLSPALGLNLDNASPSQIDIARQFVPSDPGTTSPLSSGIFANVTDYDHDNATFPLPPTGDLTLGPITTGDAYKVISASVSNLQGNLHIYSFERSVDLGRFGVQCTVRANALFRAGISA
ncbi:hypothetical protein AMS68_005266 [Peltaster fructicola]|uniref:Uncharacterized protein n=1 Tax=Peltaster fructicola TaxID=286661 RepID=A0A6H0XYQ5_9PEZI|nr:hypothetical protein AMS68_005266 [Peltaster fructicola]